MKNNINVVDVQCLDKVLKHKIDKFSPINKAGSGLWCFLICSLFYNLI